MPETVLTSEQARVVAEAKSSIVIRDPSGTPLGVLPPDESVIIAEARRRMANPGARYSTASVLAMLDAFAAEKARTGCFDETYASEFAARLEAADPAAYGPQVPR